MNKLGIWAIAIAGAFLIGIFSANPVVEAVSGWQGAIEEITSEQPVYEVSGVSVIHAGETLGNEVQLRCLEGDWLNGEGFPFSMKTEALIAGTGTRLFAISSGIHESDTSEVSISKLIGFDVSPFNLGEPQSFDIKITVSGLCLDPDFLNPDLFN